VLSIILEGLHSEMSERLTSTPEQASVTFTENDLALSGEASGNLPLIARAGGHGERTALLDTHGAITYNELLDASARVASALLDVADNLGEQRVAFLVTSSARWAAVQWGIWRAGGVVLPLPTGATRAELEYFVDDAAVSVLVFEEGAGSVIEEIAIARGIRCMSCEELLANEIKTLPTFLPDRRAMMLYTSGTTSKPKGVVTTHANIAAQVTSLVEAWGWTSSDRIVLCLPLHHIRGIINVVTCALWSGAACIMLPRFDALAVWQLIADGRLTVFMAVPTIYVRLIAAWEAVPEVQRAAWSEACGKLRLMVSGSAALPVSTLERWRDISGHTLLERYGMTEIGMALSNPLYGQRVPGTVGRPLPGVNVQLASEDGAPVEEGMPGEIEVRGRTVFKEYWQRPEATSEAFRNGWFRTGDTAVVEQGMYRILGRTNIDILKTGGHKLSALEIEEILRTHPSVSECAVVGVPDDEWGERVSAALVLRDGHTLHLRELRTWGKELMAAYKLPSRLIVVESLPRNAMGKVMKPAVAKLFLAEGANHGK
jgi:malonyl-CoA/methylmalonyl-CoA synthetase